jgi:hypothetical protein
MAKKPFEAGGIAESNTFVDSTDTTKSLTIDVGGSTGVAGVFATAFTTAKTLTFPDVTDALVARTTTDTLTNKTLTSPVISTIVNTGTLTLPTSTDTLVGRATTDTLTNKVLGTTSTTSITTNAATTVDTNALSGFTTLKYLVSIKQGSKIRSSQIIAQTDGTSVDYAEFGVVETGGTIYGILVEAAAVSTNCVLRVTISDAVTTNATVKIQEVLI